VVTVSRLSTPIESLKPHYGVVVVGSGYGGGIAASRLARAGQSVCVLERGRELQPGEYPNTLLDGIREIQTDLPGGHVGSRTGLYDLRPCQSSRRSKPRRPRLANRLTACHCT
jgi:cholesterol oxidase